jgi:hypothetical protein
LLHGIARYCFASSSDKKRLLRNVLCLSRDCSARCGQRTNTNRANILTRVGATGGTKRALVYRVWFNH